MMKIPNTTIIVEDLYQTNPYSGLYATDGRDLTPLKKSVVNQVLEMLKPLDNGCPKIIFMDNIHGNINGSNGYKIGERLNFATLVDHTNTTNCIVVFFDHPKDNILRSLQFILKNTDGKWLDFPKVATEFDY